MSLPRVLTIAGSDSGGGAGIQADIKTITVLGAFATSAVTAVTAQNTVGVRAARPLPPDLVAGQIEAVLEDIGTDAVKSGMLHSAPLIEAVAEALGRLGAPHYVLDPVLVAKSGHRLLAHDALDALVRLLFPLAELVTPNAPEAAAILRRPVDTTEQARDAARAIAELGPGAVLVKGGHVGAPGDPCVDVLLAGGELTEFAAPRIASRRTHGTGCTLSAAIATFLAFGRSLPDAVERATRFVREGIRLAPRLGAGHGPLNHLGAAEVLRRDMS
jgi:hydroxymethylpyrimidine/phosphomethylpyrimidine kinase